MTCLPVPQWDLGSSLRIASKDFFCLESKLSVIFPDQSICT